MGDSALFTEPLTVAEVLEHMRAAVEAYGADYRDPVNKFMASNDVDDCQYLYPNGKRCIIGEVVWRARGVQIPPTAGNVEHLLMVKLILVDDEAAMDLLLTAQHYQDEGERWGQVLVEAEGTLEAGDRDG